jgi:hypothetical protein
MGGQDLVDHLRALILKTSQERPVEAIRRPD